MKTLFGSLVTVSLLATASTCFANLSYNPEHDKALKHLTAVQSANVNAHYQCGQYSLFIGMFSTESDLNGRRATVTGKVTSDDSSFDISDKLQMAISRNDVLTGQMTVACNADKGAFKMEFNRGPHSKPDSGKMTIVDIFADGTVNGSRRR